MPWYTASGGNTYTITNTVSATSTTVWPTYICGGTVTTNTGIMWVSDYIPIQPQPRTEIQRPPPLIRPEPRPINHTHARDRSRELLLEHLSEQQRETFLQHGWFIVEGGQSRRKYRINGQSYQINVSALNDNDRVTHRLCAHAPHSAVPHYDHILAQKVMLELAEDDFLARANRHWA